MRKNIVIKIVILLSIALMFIVLNHSINSSKIERVRVVKDDDEICYEIEDAFVDGDVLKINGWFFQQSEKRNVPIDGLVDNSLATLLLSEIGAESEHAIVAKFSRIERLDVNSYFECETDYSHSGFIAEIPNEKLERGKYYRVLLKTDRYSSRAFETNAYLVDGVLYYGYSNCSIPHELLDSDLQKIVQEGYCLVDRPKEHCWVFQYERDLYWIVEDGFEFNSNGTCMQFQIETNQYEKLPLERTKKGFYWANISEDFEKYEVTDKQYNNGIRVSVRSLPTEYAIISLCLGYHENDSWIWKDSPIRIHYGFRGLS